MKKLIAGLVAALLIAVGTYFTQLADKVKSDAVSSTSSAATNESASATASSTDAVKAVEPVTAIQ